MGNNKKESFGEFTSKWKGYIQSTTQNISEEDWELFFAQSNPVAGIDRGAFTDIYTDNTGKKNQVNEKKTIKEIWSELSNKFNELYKLENEEEQKNKLKEIKRFILEKIKEKGGSREPQVATNRILVTLYPEKLLTIPGTNDVEKLAELLNISVDQKDWIDLCFEIKTKLESRYPGMGHWGAYLQLVQESNLLKNYNLILTGAPGTGKTFMARQMAANIIKCGSVEQLNNNYQFDFVQFHPSYDYTDFVEGLRPTTKDKQGTIVFERKDGVFKSFCAKAAIAEKEDTEKPENEKRKFVFIIDEINRGEISKIFGELFFSIDPGYRGEFDDKQNDNKVKTQYQNLIDTDDTLSDDDSIINKNKDKQQDSITYYPFKKGFYVPKNVYVIGTMNDIDRSVESMDFAFRRRFSFYEIKVNDTQYTILKDCSLMGEAIRRMNNLNKAIENIEGLSSAYHIGAAYFKKIDLYEKEKKCWESLWNNHINGLLFEYLRGLPQKDIDKKLKELKNAYDTKNNDLKTQDTNTDSQNS